jgi:hypothetical protein
MRLNFLPGLVEQSEEPGVIRIVEMDNVPVPTRVGFGLAPRLSGLVCLFCCHTLWILVVCDRIHDFGVLSTPLRGKWF